MGEPWGQVVGIVQEAFRTGRLPTALFHGVLVLVPKSKARKYQGGGLLARDIVEVDHKSD